MSAAARPADAAAPAKKDRTHVLYISVLVAVGLGIVLGLVVPDFATQLAPLGEGFVALVKMMIAPIIFCTIVLGIGSVRKAAQVGRVGGIALVYFLVMSGLALVIGLVVGNVVPTVELALTDEIRGEGAERAGEASSTSGFLLGIIPTTLVSALTEGEVLQALFVALLVGFAIQALGEKGEGPLQAIAGAQRVIFKVLAMIMWAAPVGAFGAIAGVVGQTGVDALVSLAWLMGGFYVTCVVFIVGVLGTLLKVVTGLSIFKLLRYLARELLLIVGTSSSETALPRLIAKMEHAGVTRPTVGIVVPTGYSFNLDGTAIYLTMASLFIANALGDPLSVGEQISLLVFMVIASKGAAGVTGAGLATLAGGLSSHRPELLEGVGLVVGVDRFMSEARALTNFTGNAVATLVIGSWTQQLDTDRVRRVLDKELPFDESTMSSSDPHEAADRPDQIDLEKAAASPAAAPGHR
ncbi:cation:dicarboxylate symporter family transporter [Kineococcus glutinatus]|uniref:C4-dicarboxylate transporter DctA n=1 Tax=Kineococcus glutinatus TaxID=1070872 RepID=A0ABP9HWK5_9ACTN